MSESLQKLQELLRELFRADAAELTFGIYGIINYRRKQLQAFIDDELPAIVNDALDKNPKIESTRQEIEHLKEQIKEHIGDGVLDAGGTLINEAYRNTSLVQKYLETIEQAGTPLSPDQRADAVFNHLYIFFSRYYENGDFIPRRRYSQTERYAVPYNGEEVYLHWANRDQYYVKSGKDFSTYRFESKDITVTFDLRDVDVEKDNIQGAKRFFIPISAKTDYKPKSNEVCIPFEYRPLTDEEKKSYGTRKQQDKIIDAADQEIILRLGEYYNVQSQLAHETDGVSTLKKHLRTYTRGNTADFFIHKDLKQFLNRELDVYVKNEVMPLSSLIFEDAHFQEDNLTRVGWIETAKVVNTIASQIIEFVSHIEEFQKRLWLKKKFVLSTDYCVTLDRVPEEFYAEIVENTDQLNEWKALFHIDEIDDDTTYTKPISADFLKLNSNLVLDTCHFDTTFKDRLLAHFDNLDNETGGLLIHGDNFQALNLLTEKYRESIKCVHIDPPYNTKTSGFLYKNTYQHSSWLSMMADRLTLAEQLMAQDSCILCHIDENEYEKLFLIFKTLSMDDQGTIVWDKRNPVFGTNTIATQHEYIVCHSKGNIKLYSRSLNRDAILKKAATLLKKHGGATEECRKTLKNWVNDQRNFSAGEQNYCEIDDAGQVYACVGMAAPEPRTDPKFFEKIIHPVTQKPCEVPPNGWSRAPETMKELLAKNLIIFGRDETTQPLRKIFLKDHPTSELTTLISSGAKGKPQLDAMGLNFPYCHPIGLYEELVWTLTPEGDAIILDFFAGSGTTAHATINLNRQDKGKRKYILIEMEHHFDSVLKPRIKKAIYAKEWRNARPVSHESQLSHIVKYQRIESYEDALNNIEFTERENSLFDEHPLSYLLEDETRESPTFLNISKLENPFSYQLNIIKDRQTQTVDLPETFNYLLGMSVETRLCYFDDDRRYLVYKGTIGQKSVVIVWRETDGWKEEDWERDCRFIRENKLTEGATEVYVNTDCIVPEAQPLDPLFKRLMFSE